ncbi:MAG: Na+/H+ antiporter NhaA [Micavibrio sp.]|nr:Na+/H+ antiporter NhaA [Micavibrio sp.]|tara:strand:- start:590547 stop:591791 length:1245 start_codon:yes stop_codon:yes gene_type:complete
MRIIPYQATKHYLDTFFKSEASGGILLMLASIIAIIMANSPLSGYYNYFFNEVDFRIGFSDLGEYDFLLQKPLVLWINDGLMAIFFFMIGLEIKQEIMTGSLSSKDKLILPGLAAIGGMVFPALVYYFINIDSPQTMHGWAIPAATDIAFALGILALVSSRVPVSLKVLLTAIAVIDDLGAILIIAFFYTDGLILEALMLGAFIVFILFLLNVFGVKSYSPYIILGIVLWAAVLKSGVHATLAGVLVAFFIPLRLKDDSDQPCEKLAHDLHPWVALVILPLFGFANAGVSFQGMGLDALLDPITLGIALGLFVGKQVGVFGFLWLTIKSGLSPKPLGATWRQLYALSILCGIGFTMSLFIGGLAFSDRELQASIRLGVLIGSIASATLAYGLLRSCPKRSMDEENPVEIVKEGI